MYERRGNYGPSFSYNMATFQKGKRKELVREVTLFALYCWLRRGCSSTVIWVWGRLGLVRRRERDSALNSLLNTFRPLSDSPTVAALQV